MMKTNMAFYATMIIGTIVTLSSENWLSMWMGLEMNMMSFISLMNLNTNKSSHESSMIYFLIQSISSIIMLSMIIMIMCNYLTNMYQLILTMWILIKMSSAPFHLWMPKMMSTMSWNNNLIFMTWQKISPIYLINMIELNINNNLSIVMSTLIGSLGGLYQTSLRKIMAYSSMNHLGWIMGLNKTKDNWVIYLIIYSMMVITMWNYLKMNTLMFIYQMFDLKLNYLQKMNITLLMLSMGGMPPLLGLLPKLIVIEEMISNSTTTIIIMIMTSMLTLFFYLRIIFKKLMIQTMTNKYHMYLTKYSIMMYMMNLLLPLNI
nr:NADH dehydrogenase subunit 2 [Chelurotropella siamensis]